MKIETRPSLRVSRLRQFPKCSLQIILAIFPATFYPVVAKIQQTSGVPLPDRRFNNQRACIVSAFPAGWEGRRGKYETADRWA